MPQNPKQNFLIQKDKIGESKGMSEWLTLSAVVLNCVYGGKSIAKRLKRH